MTCENCLPYYRYWGKAREAEDHPTILCHLLPFHALDVAAVAAVWWDSSAHLRQSFMHDVDIPAEQYRAWVLFFIALHDLGKIDLRFQLKAPEVWRRLNPTFFAAKLPSRTQSKQYYHGVAGVFWYGYDRTPVDNASFDQFAEPKSDDGPKLELDWMAAVGGHHGHVVAYNNMTAHMNDFLLKGQAAQQDAIARQALVDDLAALFLSPVGLTADDVPPPVSLMLAGFCCICDWLGSQESFPFCDDNSLTLNDYFQQRVHGEAQQACSPLLERPYQYQGVGVLLPDGKIPRQLQTLVDRLPVKSGLTVVEAPTGSGKTEMALALAWRLLSQGEADSIIFALPTQASANAMFARFEKLASQLFSAPNLVLAHGNASFNKLFTEIKQRPQRQLQGDEEATVQCAEWFHSRKRALLGQIGICTVDQVLVSVLPVKHRFVRQFGIGRSVLIIDEVHAYSTYMYGLLSAVLSAQKAAGGSVILLSATLPEYQRQALAHAWQSTLLPCRDYPLVSWTDSHDKLAFTLPEHDMPPDITLHAEVLPMADMLPNDELIERLLAAAQQGAQVAVICNLVDVAQGLYERLKERLNGQNEIEIQLFHARFTFNDRQVKEQAAIGTFGSEGDRSKGRILVSSQVIEQSIDVDFDWIITQLCPVDLLFQRLGRLHRHQRQYRPAAFSTPHFTVLVPDASDFGIHGLIYSNSLVMWRTWQRLAALDGEPIRFPAAYRDWIEPIYQQDPTGDEPDWILQAYEKFNEEQYVKTSLAHFILRKAEEEAIPDEDENLRAVTRDGEMSLSIVPFVPLANGQRQLLNGVNYDESPDYLKMEIRITNTVNAPDSWKKYLNAPYDDDGCIWLAGVLCDGQFTGSTVTYNAQTGLKRVQKQ